MIQQEPYLKSPFAYIYENRLHVNCTGTEHGRLFVEIKFPGTGPRYFHIGFCLRRLRGIMFQGVEIKSRELDFEAVMKRMIAL
jgi:hypothetical protein